MDTKNLDELYCEGCGCKATTFDVDGIPLCDVCGQSEEEDKDES